MNPKPYPLTLAKPYPMKKLLLLPAFLLLACKRDGPSPTPSVCAGVLEDVIPSNAPGPLVPDRSTKLVNVDFKVFDSVSGQQFKARLMGFVFYYAASLSETQVRAQASFSECGGWNVPLTTTWEQLNVPSTGPYVYDPQTGAFTAPALYAGYNTVIVWRFNDAPTSAPASARFVYQFLGVLQAGQPTARIETDQRKAGL